MFSLNNVWISKYFIVLICYIFSSILGFIIYSLSYIIAIQNPNVEKNSSYECGFEPFEDARNKFDIRFYIIAILFIIFDIEILYLFPWIVSLNVLGFENFWSMIFFLIILKVGFIYEIVKKALDWQ